MNNLQGLNIWGITFFFLPIILIIAFGIGFNIYQLITLVSKKKEQKKVKYICNGNYAVKIA